MNQRNIKTCRGGGRCSKIFHKIISLENLFSAWDEFKKGKRKKLDVQEFEYNLEDNIFKLHQGLKDKTYCHSNYTSFYVNDPKLRHIHKACVKDRILHHAIFRVLYPISDSIFIFDSYSCRNGKGTHRAVNRLQKFARKVSRNNTQPCSILKLDVRKFFDSINHDILISLIEKRIPDKNAIWLIEKIIKSFSASINTGLPLGNITSQLFANIYLNELDRFVKHELRIKYYIRYCDDLAILSDNREYLEGLIPQINNFLKEKLKLSLHSDKIIIRKYHQGVDFLGYVSFPYHRTLRTKTRRRMFRKIGQRIKKLRKNEISEESFDQTLQSYFGILKHCNSFKIKKELLTKINHAN